MRRRCEYINLLIFLMTALLALTSCVSERTAVVREEAEPVIEPAAEDPSVETAGEPLEEKYVIPVATVKDADEYVWSSILAMQNSKKAAAEAEAAVVEAEVPFEEILVEQIEDIEAAASPVETVAAEIEVPEEAGDERLEVEILDPVEEPLSGMIRAGILAEDEAVIISGEPAEADIAPVTETEGRILQTGIEDSVLWLEAEEKTEEVPVSPINVSVYEYKEEEPADDSIKPEDILALSRVYSGTREDEKKVSEMNKTEILTVVVEWLISNYRYILLGVVLFGVILLVKMLIKKLKHETKESTEEIRGPEFTEADNIAVVNPMEEGNLSAFMKEPEKEEEHEKEETESGRLEDRITVEGKTVYIKGSEALSVMDTLRLSAMGVGTASGFAV